MREYPVIIEVELLWEDGDKLEETFEIKVQANNRIKAKAKAKKEFTDYIKEQNELSEFDLSDYAEPFMDYKILRIYILNDPYIERTESTQWCANSSVVSLTGVFEHV